MLHTTIKFDGYPEMVLAGKLQKQFVKFFIPIVLTVFITAVSITVNYVFVIKNTNIINIITIFIIFVLAVTSAIYYVKYNKLYSNISRQLQCLGEYYWKLNPNTEPIVFQKAKHEKIIINHDGKKLIMTYEGHKKTVNLLDPNIAPELTENFFYILVDGYMNSHSPEK